MLIKLFKELFSRQNRVRENCLSVKDDLALRTHANEYDKSQESIAEEKKEINEPNLTKIGNIDSICPYCFAALTKKPSRKSKCPHCGQYIYVRTRPIDRQRVLVTLNQASEIEAQWCNFHRSYIYDHIDPKQIEIERDAYFKKKGIMLSDIDVKWSILNRELLEHAKNGDWGLFRNTRLSMGSVLEYDNKIKEALQTYLEVCYIDINGPRNLGGCHDPELLKKFLPFSAEEAFLAPAVVTKILELLAILHFDYENVKTVFMEVAGKLYVNLKLPVSPVQGWNQFEKYIIH